MTTISTPLTTNIAAPSPYATDLNQALHFSIRENHPVFYRVYYNKEGDKQPLGCGFGSSRFSDPQRPPRFATIYLAVDFETAFAETIVRRSRIGNPGVVREEQELNYWQVTRVTVKERLRVLALTDGDLVLAGLHPDITGADPHTPGQHLAGMAFDDERLDGVCYHSYLTHLACLAVFDRARHKLQATPHEAIMLPPWRRETLKLLKSYHVGLV
ncbi:RES family NAD+ phosphorylase [Roseospira navarrensis]|uniref:RES domain-containing protein n=1 Tax=Roseospira navarrensis TaxID=140058 RepID=A0A7X1ZGX4_9PROT|nr:RES family NAD+ phosphorylase [Roseospira navarrensis]MQX37411.1 RES domain-containing protein [Roseospira navarrensis]